MIVRADSLLLRLEFLAVWLLVAALVLGQNALASLLFTMTFFLTFGLWLVKAAERVDGLAVAILLLSGLAVCGNALLSGTAVSFSYIRKLIMFWSTILLLSVVKDHQPEPREVRFLFRGNTLLACFLLGMYLVKGQALYRINGIITGYLTFGFTNPNLAAVFLSAICMVELIRAGTVRGKKKLAHLLLGAVLAFFVSETKARNAQVILVVFLAVSCLGRVSTGGFPGRRTPGLLAAAPLLFALGYLLLVSADWVQSLFSFLAGEGKGLDSRVWIWKFALEAFLASPLLGAYSQISGGTGASQMHNSHLDILASYGVPTFLLVWQLLRRLLEGDGKGGSAAVCRGAFFALLLSGLGEAILFSGGMGIYLYAGLLRLLANFDFEKKGFLL